MLSKVQGRVREERSISEQLYISPDMLVDLFGGKTRIATKFTRHHKNVDFGHHPCGGKTTLQPARRRARSMRGSGARSDTIAACSYAEPGD